MNLFCQRIARRSRIFRVISPVFLFVFLTACIHAAPLREVIIVFKTHFDIGYTDLASNVVQRYRTAMIDQALDVADQNRNLPPEQQFAWTIPGWPLSKIAEDWPGQTPERRERIDRAFKEGRFVVHALPFSLHTELFEPEDLARGLGYAARLSRSAGLALPRDAKMTDVPCHSWIMPTLLRHAGVEFLHLGCNGASSSPRVPPLFWWVGPDGSRLLTMYSAGGYGTGVVPPTDWPYDVWLALIHTGDNHGPPQPAEVRKVLDEAAEKLPGVKVRIGRLSDFADALLSRSAQAPIPVIHSDMPDTWIHGPMCDPQGARLARNTRPLLSTTEALCTQLSAWGATPPPSRAAIQSAFEQSLLYGEHTWGGALYWIFKYSEKTPFPYGADWERMRAEGKFARNEASWAEHTGYIETAHRLITPVLESSLTALASSVQANGPRVVVYNPLPWPRGGVVTLAKGREGEPQSLKPVDGHALIPVTVRGGAMEFVAPEIPAMGYRTFMAVKESSKAPLVHVDEKAATLENKFLKLTLDPALGVVQSAIDKRTGRELVDPRSRYRMGQYLYERFDAEKVTGFVNAYTKIKTAWAINEFGKPSLPTNVPYVAASPSRFTARFECSGDCASAVMSAPACSRMPQPVTTRVSLHADQPWFEIEITLEDKPADPWPEAGWICLPIRAEHPQFRVGRQASLMDPAQDIIAGANEHLYAVNTGLSITDAEGRGAAICPLDHPLVSLGQPGCWRYSLDYVPQEPIAFINLFNNQWTTNFRFWNQGRISSRVRIWAIDCKLTTEAQRARREEKTDYNIGAAMVVPSLEARYALQAGFSDGAPGRLPSEQHGVEISREGILVTAFGENPDGAGMLLRVWEYAGHGGTATIHLPSGLDVNSAQPVDLRGTPLGAATSIRRGKFFADVRAFAPASFVLTRTTH